jgi:conjugal transfer/entry exclusion protein
MASNKDTWVQVRQQELMEYVKGVEMLSKDHSKLQEQIQDSKLLAGMIDETWKNRVDTLIDKILNTDDQNNKNYYQGLMDAYMIIQGHSNA